MDSDKKQSINLASATDAKLRSQYDKEKTDQKAANAAPDLQKSSKVEAVSPSNSGKL